MISPIALTYDGTWVGLLTLVFEVYEYKYEVDSIHKESAASQQLFFAAHKSVHSDIHKAERVEAGIAKKSGRKELVELYHAFLSELDGVELLILRIVRYYLASDKKVSFNYAHDDIIQLKQIIKSVSRERHRMKAFVRFQKLKDGLYFSMVAPDFNVLPLISKHFRDRYTDQYWLIYDQKRHYGIYYDLKEVSEIQLVERPSQSSTFDHWDETEALYGDLWKRYFKSTNIPGRKNTKLHVQHVPKRYWRYLNEKS